MTDTLVSLVIPVFQVTREQFRACVSSVLAQTHPDLEVLIVDDGSELPLEAWLRELAPTRPVRVVAQPNAGVAAARTAGVAESTGAYVGFVDADDRVEPEFVASALRLAEEADADVVFGGIRVQHEDASVRWRATGVRAGGVQVLGGDDLDAVRAAALSASPSPFAETPVTLVTNVVGALYSRRVLERVEFPAGVRHGEDRLFNVAALGVAARAAFTSEPWYVYDRRGAEGATRTVSLEAARGLLGTLRAFAALAVPPESADGVAVPPVVQEAAADGTLNYLKMLAGMAAAAGDRRAALPLVRAALSVKGVREAVTRASADSARDRLFAVCARRGLAGPMLRLGELWVRHSPTAPRA